MRKIPTFQTIDEMARFWERHDSADYEDDLEDVDFTPPTRRPMQATRVERALLRALESILRDVEETRLGRQGLRIIGAASHRRAQAAVRLARKASMVKKRAVSSRSDGSGRVSS